MATQRIRTRTVSSFLRTNFAWLSGRTLLGNVTWSGLNFQIYDGYAQSSPPTRAAGAPLTETIIDEVGPPSAGSLCRFYPDKAPYRPMSAFGPKDYYGSRGGTNSGIPDASPAHTVRTWVFTPNNPSASNSAVIRARYTMFHEGADYPYWGQEERDGVNTVIYFWGNNLDHTSDSRSMAELTASQLITGLLPNLIRGGWSQTERNICVVRPGYYAEPETQGRKSLDIKETASLADSRRLAYESMIHQASHTQLSVARGVIEMKDNLPTRKGAEEFLKTVTTVRLLLRTGVVKGLKEKVLADPMGLTLGQLASIHLWYQFGVKPTVQEVDNFMAQLAEIPVATLAASDRALLVTGQTVRSAYSIDSGVGERRIDNLCRTLAQETTTILRTDSSVRNPLLHAILNFTVPAGTLPEGNDWSHRGVLFGRAVRPEWTMMPDWFTELYDASSFEGEALVRPSKGELALYFNPPLRTLWQVAGYSWLADWAWNASQALRTLERAAMRVVCAFEELWAIDTWAWLPRRWSCVPIVDSQDVSPNVSPEIVGVPSAVEMWFPGVGYRWTPCMNIVNVYATPPPVTVKTRIRYTFVLQSPPSTVWRDVTRAQIPLPRARLPEWFPGKLDAWRISILGALSIVRLQSLSKALKRASWSLGRVLTMYKDSQRIDTRKLSLIIAGVLAAKEFTHE